MDITQVELFKYVPSSEVILSNKKTSWDKFITLTLTFLDNLNQKPMEVTFSQSIVWGVLFEAGFFTIFNKDIKSDPNEFIGKKASLVIYLGNDKPEILFIGKENEKTLLNRSSLQYEEFEAINSYTYMAYKVPVSTNSVQRTKSKI